MKSLSDKIQEILAEIDKEKQAEIFLKMTAFHNKKDKKKHILIKTEHLTVAWFKVGNSSYIHLKK